MKRLLKSSNFWNAIIASVYVVTAFKLTGSELIVAGMFSLFGLRSLVTGASDFVKANKGITYNEETQKDEMI